MPFRTLCVLLRRRASGTAFPRWSVRSDQPQYRATLRVVCLSGRSASSCNAERRELHSHAGAAERSARISCDAPRRMPFRTLCVLLRRRALRTAFPRWSVRNDQPKYRAALRVVCRSGRSASSCDAERAEREVSGRTLLVTMRSASASDAAVTWQKNIPRPAPTPCGTQACLAVVQPTRSRSGRTAAFPGLWRTRR